MGVVITKTEYGYSSHQAGQEHPVILHVKTAVGDVELPLYNTRPIKFKDINGRTLLAYFDIKNRIYDVIHNHASLKSFEVDFTSAFWFFVGGRPPLGE